MTEPDFRATMLDAITNTYDAVDLWDLISQYTECARALGGARDAG